MAEVIAGVRPQRLHRVRRAAPPRAPRAWSRPWPRTPPPHEGGPASGWRCSWSASRHATGTTSDTEGQAVARAVPDWSAESGGDPALPRSGAAPATGRGPGLRQARHLRLRRRRQLRGQPRRGAAGGPCGLFAGVARGAGGRRDDGQPRDRGHRAGRARAQDLQLPGPPVGLPRPAHRRGRRGQPGQQPRHGLRRGRACSTPSTLADDPDTGLPLVGRRPRRRRGLRARSGRPIRGQRISIFGASRVVDGHLVDSWTAGRRTTPGWPMADDPTRLLEAVRAERAQTDTLVVYLHWGQEYDDCPIDDQTEVADQLIAAGADVIVGSHAHVPLGGGMLNGSYVQLRPRQLHLRQRPRARARVRASCTSRSPAAGSTTAEWVPARITSGHPHHAGGRGRGRGAGTAWEGLRDVHRTWRRGPNGRRGGRLMPEDPTEPRPRRRRLLGHLDASPTPYHAVATRGRAARRRRASPRSTRPRTGPPTLPDRWFVRRGGALVAADWPGGLAPEAPLRIVGAHTDSPNLRLKPHPDLARPRAGSAWPSRSTAARS